MSWRSTFTQVVLKQFAGGFRPDYLEVCNPNVNRLKKIMQNVSFEIVFMDLSYFMAGILMLHYVWVSSGVRQNETQSYVYRLPSGCHSLQSFPSGHSAASFAAAIFLSLYLNAKLKTFADFESNTWSVFITIITLIDASLIAGNYSWKMFVART
jgi:diacylglycerol diphosphate phosphatase/phosphatidate phosphatase